MATVEVPDSSPMGEGLNTAEQDILEAAAAGQLTDLSTGDPEVDGVANAANWTAHRNVRAELLADLLTGDRSAGSGRLRSVKLRGARITGPFDLEARTLLGPLQLWDCYFEEPINLNDAQARSIRLRGCCVPALSADGLRATGSVELDYGFSARGEVTMVGANIGGRLTINGASLTNENGAALTADSLTVGLDLDCRALAARGEVRMTGARIGGQLIFDAASLANKKGMALDARMVKVETDLLGNGLSVQGGICMARAQIGGRLDLRRARLAGSALALDLEAATIRTLRVPRERPEGCMDLTNARVVVLDDDESEWPLTLFLRGFAYDTFKTRDINTRARLQWLRRHPGRFTPQLYDQLAAVYRQAGQDGAARRVAIAKQWRRRRTFSPLSWLWYVTVGYGYRTWQALIWLAALTVAGSLVFSSAYPAHMIALNSHPPMFQPVIYTLDVLLPVVGLGQKSAWQPTTSGLMTWYWGLTAAGWVLSAAVVVGLTGVLKRD